MKYIFTLFLFYCCCGRALAQAPPAINYQAIARNSIGQPIPNAKINCRISILDGSASGTAEYSETRLISTNQLGLFDIAIGSAGADESTGSFAAINWSTGNKFIKVEVDPSGGSNFVTLGTTELLSVPYALYAASSGNGGGSGGTTYQAGNGISITGSTISALSNNPLWNSNALQGHHVDASAPASGQLLIWDTASSSWKPGNPPSSASNWIYKNPDIYNGNSGNVGIGTDSPAYKLSVKTATNSYGILHTDGNIQLATYVGGSGQGGYIGTISNHPLHLFANGSAPLFSVYPSSIFNFNGAQPVINFNDGGNLSGSLRANGSNIELDAYRHSSLVGGAGTPGNLLLQVNSSSLLGTFTSGNVGINTANPTQKLHVSGGYIEVDNDNSYLITNSTVTNNYCGLAMRVQNTPKAWMFWDNINNQLNINTSLNGQRNDLTINAGGDISMNGSLVVNRDADVNADLQVAGSSYVNGSIGINTTSPQSPLDVESAYGNDENNNWTYLTNNGGSFGFGNFSADPGESIHAVGSVIANMFGAFSDQRIKNIVDVSNPAKDLATLNELRITNYTMKDKMMYGDKLFKKVIAQQVEKVYPQVVSKHADFIPDVYQLTSSIEKKENGYLLHFSAPHHLGGSAKMLKLIFRNGGTGKYQILSIPSSTEILLKGPAIHSDTVFVYGEQVNDFRTVDYEGLTTLNISATQELSKLVGQQAALIDALSKKVDALEQELSKIKHQ